MNSTLWPYDGLLDHSDSSIRSDKKLLFSKPCVLELSEHKWFNVLVQQRKLLYTLLPIGWILVVSGTQK